MSVYYKFNSELNFSFVDFDGLHISVSDLKKAILHQKRLGKTADFDLLISNAQTKEEYKDEHGLIPKNTSLIVARIPISNQNKKSWEIAQAAAERAPQNPSTENINHDITRMNGTEEDKIQAMMMQSTLDYDPTNYQRVRGGSTQTGDVPQNYRCHRCNKPGHWIKNCPLNVPGKEHHHFKTRPESKKMTGIPRSLRDNIGAENQESVQSHLIEEKIEVPEDLVCAICKGIFKDAVMTPCCGNSFCDECVRTTLLESEDNECPAPDCREKGTSPGSLIPNRFLRNAVADFYAKSSNVMSRDSQKKPSEEPAVQDDFEEPPAENLPSEAEAEKEPEELHPYVSYDEIPEKEGEEVTTPIVAEKDSESDDDDNITVTVPPAYQQSRGASFRDARLHRFPSHGLGDYNESFSQHSSKSHQDEGESFEEENSETYQRQLSGGSKRSNHHGYDHSSSQPPQGIATLVGEEKSGSQGYHLSGTSSAPSNHSQSHGDSQNVYQQHQQPPPIYNQHQNHSGMMPQMHSHSMYSQGPYHQQTGPYYPPNQLRPMRFDHHGNYQAPLRHHHVQNMMRPSMHDNYNMRHQRPPMNHLANAVTQNIQQRYGTGFIDDPLEAFNRIMREKEMRKDRYRRSPMHNIERRSRSFERKRSPAHPYSPDNRRQKNYTKVRKRSRSFKSNSDSRSRSRSRNRSARGRSKSRSYSPRYRRKENVQNKDRRDERHRSPDRRGNHHNNRSSRSNNFKGDSSYKQGLRDLQDNHQQHEIVGSQHEGNEQSYEYTKDSNTFEASHSFDEQPPPPGDESELPILQAIPAIVEQETQEKTPQRGSDEAPKEINGSNKSEGEGKRADHDQKKSDHHHHHKKSRGKNYETSSDDKKVRDKKKRKKSREHEKKKSKKDRKDRSEKEKEKKNSSKPGSIDRTPEAPAAVSSNVDKQEHTEPEEPRLQPINKSETVTVAFEEPETPEIEDELLDESLKSHPGKFNRSDSILDINPNVDLDLDEWIAPEVSRWERDETKSLDNVELDLGNGDMKKNADEKVTSEILKRAENAIFARAISDIRPMENKKFKNIQEHDPVASRKESSPISSVIKRAEMAKDSKIQAFQVTIPTNDSGTRSIEFKSSDGAKRKSPAKTSIKNRLGIKIVEKKSRSKTPSPVRSPKRRLQSDCTKVVRNSRERDRERDRDRGVRGSYADRSARERRPSSEIRRNRQVSSTIKVSRDTRDATRNSRSRFNNRRRSLTPERKPVARKRSRASRSPSNSRDHRRDHHTRDQRPNVDRSSRWPKESTRTDERSSKPVDQSLSDNEKAKTSRQVIEPPAKKRSRDPSSSSTSSASSSGSQKQLKRHGKHKIKKKSRSLSAESNSNSKRKKSKKEKKAKKKKKSRK